MDETRLKLLHSWLTKAGNDLRSARVLGANADGPLDTAIYHCQQTAEKAVKAFLVSRDIAPDKTHDIRALTLKAAEHEPRFNELITVAAELTPYAWEFRYPDDLAETYPTQEEFDQALRQAEAVFDFVLNLLPKEARP